MIWLIGNKGMLGTEVKRQLNSCNLDYSATDMDVDITSLEALNNHAKDIFSGKSNNWIINCSAYTAVDKAEEEPEIAEKINVIGVKNITECALKFNTKLVHISTDYVFGGTCSTPLTEDMPVSPVSVYGKTKLDGENAIKAVTNKFFIIRTAWLYGLNGSNFIYTMLKLMNDRDTISVVQDQHGSPTNAADLAGLIMEIIRQDSAHYGIYHYSNEGNITWYEFAAEIYRLGRENSLINSECTVKSCNSEQFSTKAKRPEYSLLSKEKAMNTFRITVPEWKESLMRFLKNLNELENRVSNWIDHSNYDFETAIAMHDSGRYLYVLITSQQCLEKMLKAVYEYKGLTVPRIHDLLRLAKGLGLILNNLNEQLLKDLSYYYIASRYSERIQTLSKDIDKNKSVYIMNLTKEMILWLKSMIPFV